MQEQYRHASPAAFIQRFGGALNLHIHVHAVVSDGVYDLKTDTLGRPELGFTAVPPPNPEQLAAMVTALRKKLIRRVCRAGGLNSEAAENLLSWKNSGFSIHEDVYVGASDRLGLERLLRYCSRPALSVARLIYYYGALAPRSPLRPLLVSEVLKEKDKAAIKEKADKLKKKANTWAACLARVFEVFPLICPNCKVEMKPVAAILNDKELVRLLTHLGLPVEFPVFKPAPRTTQTCGPPDEQCQLDPRADLYEDIEPAPVED